VTLEDPLYTVASFSSEVVFLSSKGSFVVIEPSFPIGKFIEQRNKKVREEM